ncbi:putative major capsid protein [Dishui Lake virophage 2]|nr:putative major capsid protein [Dishui Lake virophage 2]
MSDFKTVLVKDSVIGDITADLDFAVKSGASQTTYQRFPSTSASNSALIFNIQVPSENVVIDRAMMLTSGLTFTIYAGSQTVAGNQVPIGEKAFDYGLTDALQAFPLNSLFTTATAQINNTTVTMNTQDVLPALLRMTDSRELYRYNSMTPSFPDCAYGAYSAGVGSNNNPLGAYENASYDIDQVPRGAFPVSVEIRHFIAGVYTDASPVSTAVTDTWEIVVSTVVTEPLILSPFIFGEPEYNKQGLLGINNMSITLNVDSTCKRLFSTANNYITNIALGKLTGANQNPNGFTTASQIGIASQPSAPALLFKFLSTQPSDLIQTKNVVPYMDFPRYLTASANSPSILAGASSTLTSSNLQINQIPDLFIINVRVPMSQQRWYNTSSFLTINNISINLNNQSGLLSSASQYDLWRMSIRNGSTQSWAEFSGQALVSATATGAGALVATTGSLLVINPAYDLSLPDYISCGSLGNYNFQFQCSVTNQFGFTITPEIIIIAVNSGIFVTQSGVSSVYTGILTKEMVLSAKSGSQASAMTSAEVSRMVGGRMLNGALTAVRGMRKHSRPVGGVPSGGMAMSGGETSGGRLKKHY